MKPKIRSLDESKIANEMAFQRRVRQACEERERPEPLEKWEVTVRILSTGQEVKITVTTRALDPMAVGRSKVALEHGVELEDVRPVTSTWLREVGEEA